MTDEQIEAIARWLYENVPPYNEGEYPGWEWDDLPTKGVFSHLRGNCIFRVKRVSEAIESLGYRLEEDV